MKSSKSNDGGRVAKSGMSNFLHVGGRVNCRGDGGKVLRSYLSGHLGDGGKVLRSCISSHLGDDGILMSKSGHTHGDGGKV